MDQDDYGVPQNMFGNVDEQFYGAVGRVALLAALLEEKLRTLVATTSGKPESAYAKWPATKLAKELDALALRLRDERTRVGAVGLAGRAVE